MEVRAIAKYVKVQPRKVRIIADEVRGKDALYTSNLLRFHRSKSAHLLKKVLDSAIANAQANHDLPAENLKIAAISVDEGPRMKRMRARAQGRGYRIIKKTSHITVVVEDVEPTAPVRPHGTKAKARPSFGTPGKKKKGAAAPKAEVKETPKVVEEDVKAEEAVVEAAADTPEVVETAAEVVETAEEPAVEGGEAAEENK